MIRVYLIVFICKLVHSLILLHFTIVVDGELVRRTKVIEYDILSRLEDRSFRRRTVQKKETNEDALEDGEVVDESNEGQVVRSEKCSPDVDRRPRSSFDERPKYRKHDSDKRRTTEYSQREKINNFSERPAREHELNSGRRNGRFRDRDSGERSKFSSRASGNLKTSCERNQAVKNDLNERLALRERDLDAGRKRRHSREGSDEHLKYRGHGKHRTSGGYQIGGNNHVSEHLAFKEYGLKDAARKSERSGDSSENPRYRGPVSGKYRTSGDYLADVNNPTERVPFGEAFREHEFEDTSRKRERSRNSGENSKYRDSVPGKCRTSGDYPTEVHNHIEGVELRDAGKKREHSRDSDEHLKYRDRVSSKHKTSGDSGRRRERSREQESKDAGRKHERSGDSGENLKLRVPVSSKHKTTGDYQAEVNNHVDERSAVRQSYSEQLKDIGRKCELFGDSGENPTSRRPTSCKYNTGSDYQAEVKYHVNERVDFGKAFREQELNNTGRKFERPSENSKYASPIPGKYKTRGDYEAEVNNHVIDRSAEEPEIKTTCGERERSGDTDESIANHEFDSGWYKNQSIEQCTPLKLINREFRGFPILTKKLVSPIADTPDHIKEKLKECSTVKVSPVPMINELRVLENGETPPLVENAPSISGDQNQVCVVDVSVTTDAEHGVFKRRRRNPHV